MKFKTPIEVQAGISDGDPTNPLGQAGYLLSSDGSNVNWVSPGGLSAETAEAIVQPIKANEALVKGDPVYIVGYNNGQDVNIVAKADSSDVAKMPVVGLADDDYANQAFGTMTAFGSFNGAFDTTGGTENWAIGDIIFVKAGGGLTNVKPGGTDLIQNIAIVSRVQQNTGELEVIALGRTNDVPNLPEGRLFVGTATNTSLASDVIYVDDTNDRVGIGTTTPSTDLEVSSTGVNGVDISQSASNASQSGRLFFTTNTASEGFALFNSNGTFQVNSGGIPNNTSGTNRISIIGSSGNVGIGTTTPGAKLDVVQATTANGDAALHLIGPNTNPGLTSSVLIIEQSDGKKLTMDGNDIDVSSGDLFINDYSLEDVTFGGQIKVKGLGSPVGDSYISNGNFGVGTTSPQEKLHVVEEAPGTTLIEVENTRNSSNAGIKLSSGQTNYNIAFTNANGDFQIYNSSTGREEITIAANGNVGIRTTSPSEKLEVSGNVKANNYINQRVAWNSGFNHGSNNAASYYFIPVGYIAETTGDTYYNNWIAPYAGRVRKIVLRNTGQSTVPTATTVNFRVSVNGSVVHTGSTITVTGSGLNILASETLSDSTAVFSATDRVQVAYRTNGFWRNVAAGISLEYTE